VEPWSLSRYGHPYLAVDDITADEDAKSVTVTAGGEAYDIEAPGARAGELARTLARLRDPGASLWAGLTAAVPAPTGPAGAELAGGELAGGGAAPGEALRELVGTLDTLGLVANADTGGAATARDDERTLAGVVAELSGWLLAPPAPGAAWDAAMIADRARAVLAHGQHPWQAGLPAVAGARGTDFPLTTLVLQRRYWQASAPLAASAVDLLLAQVLGTGGEGAAQSIAELAGGPESVKDAVTAACAAASLLALSTLPDAPRAYTPPVAGLGRISGINLALASERTARETLESIGQPRYVSALERGDCPGSYIRGAFTEQYYVNLRFVETICPSLTRRLRGPLRDRLYRYFQEEYGHEDFERATCLSLGVTPGQLDAYVPLPYHSAYVDAFIAVAQAHPVAYLACVMVTEGLPGEPYGLNDLIDIEAFGAEFAAVFREHEQVNTDMAHDTLARHLLAEVPSVGPRQHATALDCTAYLTELTHRAWDLLFDLHSGGPAAVALPPLYARQR
jgi:heme oxygenase-like protein